MSGYLSPSLGPSPGACSTRSSRTRRCSRRSSSSRSSSSRRSPAGCRRSRRVPGFDYPGGYTAFQFVFVLLQSAAFGGVFTGFGIAPDFEYGFSRRLFSRRRTAAAISSATRSRPSCRWALVARPAHGRGPHRRHGRRRRRRRPVRALRPRRARELRGNALGNRGRHAVPLDPGRADHAVPGLHRPVLRAGLRAARAAHRLDPRRRHREPGDALPRGRPEPARRGPREEVLLGFALAFAVVALFTVWALRGLRSAERAGAS